MSTNLTEWSSDILAHAKRASDRSAKKAVRDAAILFCEKTWLWTVALSRISVVADQQDYTLTDPSDAEIVTVDNVKFKENGQDDDQFRRLDPISETQQDLIDSGSWQHVDASNPSEYWIDVVDKQLHCYPIPTDASTEGLLVKVVLRPSISCTSLPDFLYKDYRIAIKQGALADLFSQEVMDWAAFDDPVGFSHLLNKSRMYNGLFTRACNEAKVKRVTGATKRPLRVKFQSFC